MKDKIKIPPLTLPMPFPLKPITIIEEDGEDGRFPNPPPPIARRYELILPCMCCQAPHYMYITLVSYIERYSVLRLAMEVAEHFPFRCKKCGQTNYVSYYIDWLVGGDIAAFGRTCKVLMLTRTLNEDDVREIIEQVRLRYGKKDKDI